jgi:hypothetical protein
MADNDRIITLSHRQFLEAIGDYLAKHRLAPDGLYHFAVTVAADNAVIVKMIKQPDLSAFGDDIPTTG